MPLLRNYRKDGRLFWNQITLSPVRDDNGTITHYLGVLNDVTELTIYRRELEHRASHDILTGLANRSLLDDRLAMALAAAQRHGRLLAVAFLDLDHFKEVNDTLGHAVGDELLMAVARRLLACVREGDTVARHGGDEFILVLSEQASEASVVHVLKRVRDVIARPYPLAGHRGATVVQHRGQPVSPRRRGCGRTDPPRRSGHVSRQEFGAQSVSLLGADGRNRGRPLESRDRAARPRPGRGRNRSGTIRARHGSNPCRVACASNSAAS